VADVSIGSEIREFLTSRRGRITPEQAGLRNYGGRRRVSGLRREEVAMVAGISAEYYTQLERGNVSGVSEDVLDAIARALQLDDVERAHLFHLVRAAKQLPVKTDKTTTQVRPSVQRVLDSMTEAVAFVRNSRQDVLSANRLGYALYADLFANPQRPANLARFVFLDPRARDFYVDWNGMADAAAFNLRATAGRDPYDRALTDLVGELSMRSDDFRERWASQDVRQYRSGTQRFRHPLVGELELAYEALAVTAALDEIIIVYTADPDTPTHDALQRLANGSTPHRGASPTER
jgi:transcriptional regulator with XRE-family HTH domain